MASWREVPPGEWQTALLRPGERAHFTMTGVAYAPQLFDQALVELAGQYTAQGWRPLAWTWKAGELTFVVEALERDEAAELVGVGGQLAGWPVLGVAIIFVAGALLAWANRRAVGDLTATIERIIVFAEGQWPDVRALAWAGLALAALFVGYLYVRRFT